MLIIARTFVVIRLQIPSIILFQIALIMLSKELIMPTISSHLKQIIKAKQMSQYTILHVKI